MNYLANKDYGMLLLGVSSLKTEERREKGSGVISVLLDLGNHSLICRLNFFHVDHIALYST